MTRSGVMNARRARACCTVCQVPSVSSKAVSPVQRVGHALWDWEVVSQSSSTQTRTPSAVEPEEVSVCIVVWPGDVLSELRLNVPPLMYLVSRDGP